MTGGSEDRGMASERMIENKKGMRGFLNLSPRLSDE
jgi:hypothetical protein